MATVLYSATASLDGYIAGPGGDMSWLTEHLTGTNPTAERLLGKVGAILAGNATFGGDDPNRGTDKEGAFGGRYHGPVFVLTHRPPVAPPAGVTFVDDLHSAVAQAKEAAGDGYVNILGANVAEQCLQAGLLDEILILFAPGYARMRLAIFIAGRHRRSRRFGWMVITYLSADYVGLINLDGTVAAPRPFRAWRDRPNAGGERRR